jgi:hypothetical protein
MKIIKPNSNDQIIEGLSVFCAGSIEMGQCEDWQTKTQERFEEFPITLLNPRRDDWDSSWTQEQKNPQFNYQVNWEMDSLDKADIIFMYFSPETKSPISLLELGAYGSTGKMIVCCPDGFWRKGNVEIFCSRHDIQVYNDIEDAYGALMTRLHRVSSKKFVQLQ